MFTNTLLVFFNKLNTYLSHEASVGLFAMLRDGQFSQLLTTWNKQSEKILHITVVIRYNTIDGVHKYESCYKPIVLYEMARFYLVLLGRYDWRYTGCGNINN